MDAPLQVLGMDFIPKAPLIAVKFIPTSCVSFVCPVIEGAVEFRLKDRKSLEIGVGYGKLPSILQSAAFNDLFFPIGSSRLTDFKFSLDYRWLKTKQKHNLTRFNSIGFLYYTKEFSFPTDSFSHVNSVYIPTPYDFKITQYCSGFNYKIGRILQLNSYLNLEMYLGAGFVDIVETHHGAPKEARAPYKYSFTEGDHASLYIPFGIKICYYKS